MPLVINGVTITSIVINNNPIQILTVDGVTVFSSSQPLDTPTGLYFSETNLQWNDVSAAASYQIEVVTPSSGTVYYSSWYNKYSINSILETYGYGLYEFSVQAISNSPNYTNSSWSSAVQYNNQSPSPDPWVYVGQVSGIVRVSSDLRSNYLSWNYNLKLTDTAGTWYVENFKLTQDPSSDGQLSPETTNTDIGIVGGSDDEFNPGFVMINVQFNPNFIGPEFAADHYKFEPDFDSYNFTWEDISTSYNISFNIYFKE